MVRRTTHLALVVFAVLVATGPSVLALADTGGTTGTDSGVAAAAGPLDATDDLLDETTDANVTDENLTEDTDENTTNDETVENETVGDETTDAAETLTNETVTNETTTVETTTNASDGATTDLDAGGTDATTEAADSEATTESESLTSDATNASETATSVTDGTAADGTDVNGTDTDGTDAADVIETIDDAASGATDANLEYDSLDATASSHLNAENVGDVPLEDGDVGDSEIGDSVNADEESDSGVPDDSAPATDRERRTENETTAAVAGDDGEAGSSIATGEDEGGDEIGGAAGDGGEARGGDAGTGDAKSPADETDSDGSPDRDSPANSPSGPEAVAGVGALAVVAVFPHLTDSLTLAGDARALSAASSTAASSRSLVPLQGEFDKVWRTATAFRYSRYDDSDPLAHETRATLHETVERSPGAYLSEVCERADVAVSTARHHLDVLEDEGLVTTAKVRGKRRYFPGHGDDVELAAALEDDEAAAVLRALARLGDSHGGRLADELDRDPSTVSHHLARLEDAGLVEREREGRAVVNRLAPEVARVLDEGCDEDSEEIAGDREADSEPPAVAD